MRLTRPVIGLVAASAVVAVALPSQAAASRTLYFDNQGTSGQSGCTPGYVLTKNKPSGTPCGNLSFGYGGQGASGVPPKNGLPTDVYTAGASSTGFKLNAARPMTGTVYIAVVPAFSGSVGPASTPETMGGPAGATVTFKINGVTVGKVTNSGVVAPGSTVAIPVKVKLPAKLNGKQVKSVEADVTYTAGWGVTVVSYSKSAQSRLVLSMLPR